MAGVGDAALPMYLTYIHTVLLFICSSKVRPSVISSRARRERKTILKPCVKKRRPSLSTKPSPLLPTTLAQVDMASFSLALEEDEGPAPSFQ